MEGSGGGSPSESEITEIGKTPDPTSNSSEHESHGSADGGGSEGGGGDGASGYAAEVKVEEGESVMGDAGSHHGRTTEILPPPPPDGINRSRKSDDKVVQHADTAVAPVASTSFKRSGGTGASSRRTAQKRVVTVPIAEIGEGVPRPRSGTSGTAAGEGAPPPSDSWTWRKYGQKPIKGSPYPRGYYRCSSSKGCPARKQVERSRADPKMLIVTYASDHNHPWPLPRNGTHHASRNSTAVQASLAAGPPPQVPPCKLPSSCADEEDMEVEYEIVAATEEEELVEDKIIPQPIISISTTTTSTDKATTSSPSLETSSADNSLSGASDDSTTLIPPLAPDGVVDDLCSTWFPVVDHEISLCSTTADTATKMMIPFSYDDLYADLLGNKRPSGGGCGAEDDDDSLFAGLGELPEFSLVFRRGVLPELDADFTRGW